MDQCACSYSPQGFEYQFLISYWLTFTRTPFWGLWTWKLQTIINQQRFFYFWPTILTFRYYNQQFRTRGTTQNINGPGEDLRNLRRRQKACRHRLPKGGQKFQSKGGLKWMAADFVLILPKFTFFSRTSLRFQQMTDKEIDPNFFE